MVAALEKSLRHLSHTPPIVHYFTTTSVHSQTWEWEKNIPKHESDKKHSQTREWEKNIPKHESDKKTFSNTRVRKKHSQTWEWEKNILKHEDTPHQIGCCAPKDQIYIAPSGALYATHCSCSYLFFFPSCGILLEMAIKSKEFLNVISNSKCRIGIRVQFSLIGL